MLVKIGSEMVNIHDDAFNKIASNPFKFPRPSNMAPVRFENNVKKPNVPLTYSLQYLFEECRAQLLRETHSRMKRMYTGGTTAYLLNSDTMGVKLGPWEFLARCNAPNAVTFDQMAALEKSGYGPTELFRFEILAAHTNYDA